MRTEQTDKASSFDSWPKCYRLSNTENLSYTEHPAQPHRLGSPGVPSGPEVGPCPADSPAAPSNAGRAGANEERGRGCREEATMWFQLTLSAPPRPFLHSFSFQTGKSVSRSGSVFPPLLFLPNPGPSSCPSASSWGARWKPLCARERGAASAAAHGRRHPARTPRRRAQFAQGPSAAPRHPRQRLSREVLAPGIGMTLLLLLWLGECLGAGGRQDCRANTLLRLSQDAGFRRIFPQSLE